MGKRGEEFLTGLVEGFINARKEKKEKEERKEFDIFKIKLAHENALARAKEQEAMRLQFFEAQQAGREGLAEKQQAGRVDLANLNFQNKIKALKESQGYRLQLEKIKKELKDPKTSQERRAVIQSVLSTMKEDNPNRGLLDLAKQMKIFDYEITEPNAFQKAGAFIGLGEAKPKVSLKPFFNPGTVPGLEEEIEDIDFK